MKKFIFTIMLLAASFGVSSAQGFFSATYDMGMQLGESGDYIGKFSARGFSLEGRSFISNNFSLGGSFSWHTYYEATGVETFEVENTSVTGKQYRYINAMPLLVNAHYYMAEDGDVRFYAGGGIGTSYIVQRTELGLYAFENKAWTFTIAPEIGVLIPINFNNAINLAVKYHYSPKAKDLTSNITYISFKVGFAFM